MSLPMTEQEKLITFVRMETRPEKRPTAKYCPSLVQAQQVARDVTFNFVTDFCSGLHRPAVVGFKIDGKLNLSAPKSQFLINTQTSEIKGYSVQGPCGLVG